MLRISTNQIHQTALQNITAQQIQVSLDQQHIATGKRILTPSEDPVGSSKVLSISQEIAMNERLQENSDLAQGRLELSDSILTNISSVLQRVRELTIQGSNDSNSAKDRQSIAIELQNRLEEVQGLINSADGNGDYLFAGYQSKSEPFIRLNNGTYAYNGDDGQLLSEISPGMYIPVTDSGYELFASIPNGNGTFDVSDGGGVNTGTAVLKQTSISGSATYVPDNYTVTFVTNASGAVGVKVIGATTGQVYPPLPAILPGAAPTFTSPQTIQFNGIQLDFTGAPNPGDAFHVTPSTDKNILTTMKAIVDVMSLDTTTPTASAHFRNELNRALPGIDQALETINAARIQVGSRLNTIDSIKNVNEDFILHSKTVMSGIEDLDFAAAITDFESRTVALQAAQQSFVRIRNLSLFNYIS